MKIKNILIAQPEPANGSPYSELVTKHKITIDFIPFFKVEPLSAKEFRLQKVSIPDSTAIVFSARSAIDAFFKICEELRITVPETMKYFCNFRGSCPLSAKVYRIPQKKDILWQRNQFINN
jgi:Uroporphyrinogen-III synthase HemD.